MDGRPNTALLVVDVQNDVVVAAHKRNEIVGTIAQLVDRARAAGTAVIWIQHDDDDLPVETDGWHIVPELVPTADEVLVRKNFRSSFHETTLEETLAELDVGRLLVTGAQTDFCVRWTLHAALERGYETVLVADAHTTDDVSPEHMPQGAELIAHTNSVWASQATTDAAAKVVASGDVSF